MTENDLLQRFIFANAPVRGEHVILKESFLTIVNQHPYPAPVKRILGEALAVAALLSAIIKFQGRLTVQFRGKGGVKLLLAQCDNNFHLRGLVKWEGEHSYEALMESFNEGVLVIMLDSGLNQTRYQGIVAWRGNSLVESIEGYFNDSEQLATKIWLAVNDEAAAGFLLQVVPVNKKDETGIENQVINPSWMHLRTLSEQLQTPDLLTQNYEDLLLSLYPEEDIHVFPAVEVKFQCTCSRPKSADAIYILGREEAEEELRDHQSIVVTCDFCNKEYVFDRVDVAKIFEDRDKPSTDTHLH